MNEEMPLPIVWTSEEELDESFLAAGDDPSNPLVAAMRWMSGIQNAETELGVQAALEVTLDPGVWGDFSEVRSALETTTGLSSFLTPAEDEPDRVVTAYVVEEVPGGVTFMADARVPAFRMTLVKCEDGWWRVFALSNGGPPLQAADIFR